MLWFTWYHSYNYNVVVKTLKYYRNRSRDVTKSVKLFAVFNVVEIKTKLVLYFPYYSKCAGWKIQHSGW